MEVGMQETQTLFDQVLLIEDDSAHALLITRALKPFTNLVDHATNKNDALLLLTKNTPFKYSCIISDLNLPDGKEMEIIEPVLAAANNIPVVVLTSSTSLATAIEAMKRGARDYIVKNFGPDFKDTLGLALQRVSISLQYQLERERLQKEMAILRLAVENSTDGVAILTSDLNIAYKNQAFLELIERTQGSTLTVQNLFSDSVTNQESLTQQLTEYVSGARETSYWTTELSTSRSMGIAYRLELSKIQEANTWALWVHDISEEKRRERFQREMLSTTTHDLKGPLGAILISSELISSKDELPEKIKQLAIRIGSAAQGAVTIIDEFLSARRIQEGTFILKPSIYNLSELLSEIGSQYDPMFKAKNLEFSWANSLITEPSLDKLGMTRVLSNLIGNSIKFTPKGGKISIEVNPSSNEEYTISISDTGSGMEPQEAKKLFERFSRLQKHQNVEGTGIGLYVVRAIVEAHGGRISVTSSPNNGSTFSLILPFEPPVNANGELFVLSFS